VPEQIEETLRRLMPVAISEEGQRSLDAMLDELCGVEQEAVADKRVWRFAVPGLGIAAAIILGFSISPPEEMSAPALAEMDTPLEMVLVGKSNRIETATDEGWVADPQGATMQAVRVRVVGENTFHDQETDILVNISEPREELLLFPVSAF